MHNHIYIYIYLSRLFSCSTCEHVKQPREEMAPSFDLVDDAIEVDAHAATEEQFVDLIR
jgi:hypothetical protein